MKNKKSFLYLTIVILMALGVTIILINVFSLNKSIINNQSHTDDGEDWSIYESKEFGFSIKYPVDWILEALPSFIDGFPVDNGSVAIIKQNEEASKRYQLSILLHENPNHLTAEQWARDIYKDEEVLRIKFLGGVDIGQYKGFGITHIFNTEGYDERLFLATNDTVFQFIYPINEENENYFNPVENYDVAKKILSTLIIE